jgi:uncharacterized protein YdeI (YjbR/CyaY-like superfamily)
MPSDTALPELRRAFFARDRDVWRKWLARHHQSAAEVWLLLYKKHTGTPCLSMGDAVEEALCYGWIDGKLRRVDDGRHLLRFCPRRPKSVWSASNRARVARLVQEGRMAPAGLEAVQIAKKNGQWQAAQRLERTSAVPADLAKALAASGRAASYFDSLAPSYRKTYVAWVLTAKRAETRAARIRAVVSRSARGVKPGIDL